MKVATDSGQFIESFCNALLGKSAIEGGLALPADLESADLDFTMKSLRCIDSYLLHLHRHEAEISVQAYINSLMACAFYVGEVICHTTSSSQKFQWATSLGPDFNDETARMTGWTHVQELATLVSARGHIATPGRVVARILRRGAKAQSCYAYARTVIGLDAISPAVLVWSTGGPLKDPL
jgi:hypothetical protein